MVSLFLWIQEERIRTLSIHKWPHNLKMNFTVNTCLYRTKVPFFSAVNESVSHNFAAVTTLSGRSQTSYRETIGSETTATRARLPTLKKKRKKEKSRKKTKKKRNKKEKRMSPCRRKSERQIIRRNDQARRPIEIQFPKGGNA